MLLKFASEIDFGADVKPNGAVDDRVTYTLHAGDLLLGQLIYQLGKTRFDIADGASLNIAITLQLAGILIAEFDRRANWSDFEFEYAV